VLSCANLINKRYVSYNLPIYDIYCAFQRIIHGCALLFSSRIWNDHNLIQQKQKLLQTITAKDVGQQKASQDGLQAKVY